MLTLLNHGRNILTRRLPKTGQTTSYQAGDDGTWESGWWHRRLNINNRTRFVVKTVTGTEVVIDRATGLLWVRDLTAPPTQWPFAAQTWANAITFCNNYGLGTLIPGTWRLPNVNELISIVDYSNIIGNFNSIFLGNFPDHVWTSTTYSFFTTRALYIDFSYGTVLDDLKTNVKFVLPVTDWP